MELLGKRSEARWHLPATNGQNNSFSQGEKKKERAGKYVIGCTIIATVSSTLLGYDIGVMSGAIIFIQDRLNLSTFQVEMVVGSLNIVSVLGGAIAGRLSDAIGRRFTMAVAAAIFFAGAALMAFAPSFAVLMLGRVVSGIGVGFALMIAPVYSAELSPARVRGSLVSLTEIFINFGILVGYIVNFAFSELPTSINWRLMLGLGALPAILLACGVLVMPESPRWLVTQKRITEAKDVLIKTSNGDKEEANLRLREIMETVGFASLDPNVDPTAEEYEAASHGVKKQGEGVWRELLWPTRFVRRLLIVALGVHFFQQATGIDAIVYYSPVVFTEAGITSRLGKLGATIGVGATKFSFIFVAFFLLDRFGRKPLLLISGSGLSLSLVAVAVAFITLGINSSKGDTLISAHVDLSHKAPGAGAAITIFAICSYVAFFSIGFGPIAWVFLSEIFPLRIRAQAVGLGVVMNRLVSGVVALTFLSISNAITPAGTFFLFAGIGVLSVVFIFFLVPETKGRSLEELAKYFEGHEEIGQSTDHWSLEQKLESGIHAIELAGAPTASSGRDEPNLMSGVSKDERLSKQL